MNNGFAGYYRPDLLPGGTQGRPEVDTAVANPRGTSLSAIESRLRTLRSQIPIDYPMLRTFFDSDIPYLMGIARAADRWAHSTNAEGSRRAADELNAAVRR